MALNTQMSNAAVNAEADALARLLDNGYVRLYTTAQPANADTAIAGQTLLAELRINATSAPAASAGVLTFNALTQDSSANATGTVTWYRALGSNGTSVYLDGTVGTSGANMNLGTVSIVSGAIVSVTSWTHTVAKATAGS